MVVGSTSLFAYTNIWNRRGRYLLPTSLSHLYDKPSLLAPAGTSDHNAIKWSPSRANIPRHNVTKHRVRRLISQNWSMDKTDPSTEDLASDFTERISKAMDIFFPQVT